MTNSQGLFPLGSGIVAQQATGQISQQVITEQQQRYQPGLLNAMGSIDNFSFPVGMYVPQALKQHIWKGELIEFSDLLPQNRGFVEAEGWLSAYVSGSPFEGNTLPASVTSQLLGATLISPGQNLGFHNNNYGRNGRQSKRYINNIGEWTDAMLVYLSLYSSKHPEQALALVKYCTTIKGSSDSIWD